MRSCAQFPCCCLRVGGRRWRRKLPPLDADFLEYLANLGGDEEDWALFADEDEPRRTPPAKAAGGQA